MSFELRSPAFSEAGPIPQKYTADGDDVSPPLIWAHPPAGTQSFVLIVEDPDAPDPSAPKRVFVHWLVYNLPATMRKLDEGAGLPAGAGVGLNDFERKAYGGPNPPIGRHRYFFRLYALDTQLDDPSRPLPRAVDKTTLLEAMEGHVLGEAQLIGTYQKRTEPSRHAQP